MTSMSMNPPASTSRRFIPRSNFPSATTAVKRTKITEVEKAYLDSIGGCCFCRKPGHFANERDLPELAAYVTKTVADEAKGKMVQGLRRVKMESSNDVFVVPILMSPPLSLRLKWMSSLKVAFLLTQRMLGLAQSTFYLGILSKRDVVTLSRLPAKPVCLRQAMPPLCSCQ